jgi:hypothetical protein
MAEKLDAPAEGALVKDSYYHDGARWERDIYRRLELSRNAWRLVAIGSRRRDEFLPFAVQDERIFAAAPSAGFD